MPAPLPSLNALRAFESIARHLHYPSAAAELNVSPAAVKQLVSKLESTVGVPLIERRGKGLALTANGEASQSELTAAMNLLAAAVQKMQAPAQKKQLIVSVESSLAATWLVPKLADFKKHFPDVNVLIDSTQEVVDLHRTDVDVAIRYGVNSDESLVANRLFEDLIFPVCSPSMMTNTKLTTVNDLNNVPLIHWDISRLPWAKQTQRWFNWKSWLNKIGASNVSSNDGLYFSDYGLAVQSAIAGQGVVLASWPILKNVVDAGLLVQPLKETVSTDIGYDIVTTHAARESAEVGMFVSWILQASAG